MSHWHSFINFSWYLLLLNLTITRDKNEQPGLLINTKNNTNYSFDIKVGKRDLSILEFSQHSIVFPLILSEKQASEYTNNYARFHSLFPHYIYRWAEFLVLIHNSAHSVFPVFLDLQKPTIDYIWSDLRWFPTQRAEHSYLVNLKTLMERQWL